MKYNELDYEFDLSRDKVDNLVKLAEYLERLPEDYPYFGMKEYFLPVGTETLLCLSNQQRRDMTQYALHNGGVHTCGTAACAVGHGPSAGILFHENEIDSDAAYDPDTDSWSVPTPLWNRYAERAFVSRSWGQPFEFLFGGGWSTLDDTHRGAAARIRYLLDKVEVLPIYQTSITRYQHYVVKGDVNDQAS